jgi:hypothetical protein
MSDPKEDEQVAKDSTGPNSGNDVITKETGVKLLHTLRPSTNIIRVIKLQ